MHAGKLRLALGNRHGGGEHSAKAYLAPVVSVVNPERIRLGCSQGLVDERLGENVAHLWRPVVVEPVVGDREIKSEKRSVDEVRRVPVWIRRDDAQLAFQPVEVAAVARNLVHLREAERARGAVLRPKPTSIEPVFDRRLVKQLVGKHLHVADCRRKEFVRRRRALDPREHIVAGFQHQPRMRLLSKCSDCIGVWRSRILRVARAEADLREVFAGETRLHDELEAVEPVAMRLFSIEVASRHKRLWMDRIAVFALPQVRAEPMYISRPVRHETYLSAFPRLVNGKGLRTDHISAVRERRTAEKDRADGR